MLREGRLEAVLLTGLSSPEFFDLIQRYVDHTSDVQTAAILGLHACKLCRYPTSSAGAASLAAATAALSLQPPPVAAISRRGSGQLQTSSSRLRLRQGKDVTGGVPATPPPPGDQAVAKIGGRKLANWVER